MPRKNKQTEEAVSELPVDMPFAEDFEDELCDCDICNCDPILGAIRFRIELEVDDKEEEETLKYLVKLGQKFMEINAIVEEMEGKLGDERAESILEEAQDMTDKELEAAVRLQNKPQGGTIVNNNYTGVASYINPSGTIN